MSLSGEAVLYAASPSDKAAQDNARRERRRRKIVKELFNTEKTYLQHLEIISKFFEFPLRFACIVPEEVYTCLFSNLEQIHDVNVTLLEQMEQSTIGQAFCQLGPFLKLYSTYANNHQFALRTIQEWQSKNPAFANFITKQEDRPEVKGLKLNALLIMPVQRIPRYKLLLEDLLENTPVEHHDYEELKEAAEKIGEIAHHINEHIRQNENFMKMLAIQRSFYNSVPNLLVPGRIFIKEGPLKKVSRKGSKSFERMFFLFSDILLYGKSKFLDGAGSSYSCSCILPLKHCRVEPVFITDLKKTDAGGAFVVTCKEESLLLYSDDIDNAQEWVNEIDKAARKLCDDRQTLRRLSSNKVPLRGRSLRRHRQLTKKSENRIPGKTPLRPLSQCSLSSDMEIDSDCSPNVRARLAPVRRRFRQLYNNNSNTNNNSKDCRTVEEEEGEEGGGGDDLCAANSTQLEFCSGPMRLRKRNGSQCSSTEENSTTDGGIVSLSDTESCSTMSADDKAGTGLSGHSLGCDGGGDESQVWSSHAYVYTSHDETMDEGERDGEEEEEEEEEGHRQSIRQYSFSLRGSRSMSQEDEGCERQLCRKNSLDATEMLEVTETSIDHLDCVVEASAAPQQATAESALSSSSSSSSSPPPNEPYYPPNSPAHKHLNKKSLNKRLRSYLHRPLKRFQQAKKELSKPNPCSPFRSAAVSEKSKMKAKRK